MNGGDEVEKHSGGQRADPSYSINDRLPGKVDSALPHVFPRGAGFYDSAPLSRGGIATFERIPSRRFEIRSAGVRFAFLRFSRILRVFLACERGLIAYGTTFVSS